MSSELTEEQVCKIVAEVGRMTKEREERLDREDVKQILEALNLPPEMLDEAILRINHQEVVKRSEERNRRLWISTVAVGIAVIAGGLFWFQQHRSTLARVTAIQDRITLPQEGSVRLTAVNRQQVSEIFYRVTLSEVPVGNRLSLKCNWTDPSGAIVRENRYQTQTITTSVWETHCRLPLDTGATPGTWKVEMFLDDRPLDTAEFQVQ